MKQGGRLKYIFEQTLLAFGILSIIILLIYCIFIFWVMWKI